MSQARIPITRLNSGVEIPQLGFGSWPVESAAVLRDAIEAGYRHIDTAAGYGALRS